MGVRSADLRRASASQRPAISTPCSLPRPKADANLWLGTGGAGPVVLVDAFQDGHVVRADGPTLGVQGAFPRIHKSLPRGRILLTRDIVLLVGCSGIGLHRSSPVCLAPR